MNENITVSEFPVIYGGRRIYGEAFIPQGQCGKLPAVILCHGYNSSHIDVTDLALRLAGSGVFAYCFDFCGGSLVSKSSGRSEDMSIQTEMCDLKEVVKTIQGLKLIDRDRIYLYGESQGGFVSALTAADDPDDFAGLFLLYPAFCIPDDWEKFAAENKSDSIELMGMTLSRKFYDELPKYDVFRHVSRFAKKVLIAHGTDDHVVSIEYSRKLAVSFPDANLTEYKDQGHGFNAESREKWIEQICRTFQANQIL